MKKRRIFILLMACVLVFSLIGCTSTQTGGESSENPENEITNGEEQENEEEEIPEIANVKFNIDIALPTLDPQLSNSIVVSGVGSHILEGLVRVNGNEILPGIAKEWEISDDGLVYTFHLREAYWSDGEPIKAQDFEYAIHRLLDPNNISPASSFGYIIKNGAEVNKGEADFDELGIKVLDDKTIEITLREKSSYFLSLVGKFVYSPVRKDYVEKYDQDFAGGVEKNVYNGPFVIKEWKREDRIILEKNPNYWNKDEIKLDEVEIVVVPNADTALGMYENGNLDFINELPMIMASQYSDSEELEYFNDGKIQFLRFNLDGTRPLLSNFNFRKAVYLAIDKVDYTNIVSSGIYVPNNRVVMPGIAGADGAFGDEYPLDYTLNSNVEEAKELLNIAMEEEGIEKPEDIVLELLISDTERVEGEILQDMLRKNLGIEIELKQLQFKQKIEQHVAHNYELFLGGWSPDYNDPLTYITVYDSESPYNHASYYNDEFDSYLKEAAETVDRDERMELLFKAEKKVLEDYATVPLLYKRSVYLKKNSLKGVNRDFQSPRPSVVFAYWED